MVVRDLWSKKSATSDTPTATMNPPTSKSPRSEWTGPKCRNRHMAWQRLAHRLTVQEIAQRLMVSVKYYQEVERGTTPGGTDLHKRFLAIVSERSDQGR